MPKFTLDGKEIPFEEGDTIIRAAWRAGIDVPHYCWHPGLSVAANCRMCLVEIRSGRQMALPILKKDPESGAFVSATKPKLMPACQTPASDGAEVYAASDEAKQAHSAVQEMLLLNHPVDCPICDQAGECKLQDYWLENQHSLKRKLTEPVHKPKAVRFGEKIVYDAERCVMCTRCVRFCDEVVGDHTLDMRERGNLNEIVLSPGRELDHNYSLMTEHVCPVGALTSQDFRFKARVWFLKTANSVCNGCATGCNSYADYDPRIQQIQRLRPRDNPEVNQFWMCDDGMLSYHAAQQDRLLYVAGKDAGWGERFMLDPAAGLSQWFDDAQGKRVVALFNAAATNEENEALAGLAKQLGATTAALLARPDWEGDEILRDVDHNPNRRGAAQAAASVDLALTPLDALERLVSDGKPTWVVGLGVETGLDLSTLEALFALEHVSALWFATHRSAAVDASTVAVPVAHWSERAGTYVNRKDVPQRFDQAVQPSAGQPPFEVLVTLALREKAGSSPVAEVVHA